MTTTVDTTTPSFQIKVPEEQLDDLRRRIGAMRWPAEELVPDRSQGVQRATLLERSPATGPASTTGAGARRG
jgi:hypothetical protein